ncbi:MAG: hypothetical protein K8S54_04340 [Spirochaetia bacterium]|nr:hypothetical protein [Spirochaetia bacterium]
MKATSVFALLVLAVPLSLSAINEFTATPKATKEEEAAYKDLVRQIAETQRDIEAYFVDLKERQRIVQDKDANGKPIGPSYSEFEITSEVQTYYGQRDRYVYTERVRLEWDIKSGQGGEASANIKGFNVSQRRGRVGQSYVLKRRITADVLPQAPNGANALPLNLVVNELLDSGKGLFLNFRFPDADVVRDKDEVIEIDGIKKEIHVIYVRSHSEKMRLLREYRDVLKLTWRRVDWEIRSGRARNEMEMQRILRKQVDY